MRFVFTITVETERESGKFASRDDVGEYIRSELEGANPGSVDGVGADGESVYEIVDWNVEEAS